jgi:hypothetical protein
VPATSAANTLGAGQQQILLSGRIDSELVGLDNIYGFFWEEEELHVTNTKAETSAGMPEWSE